MVSHIMKLSCHLENIPAPPVQSRAGRMQEGCLPVPYHFHGVPTFPEIVMRNSNTYNTIFHFPLEILT